MQVIVIVKYLVCNASLIADNVNLIDVKVNKVVSFNMRALIISPLLTCWVFFGSACKNVIIV